MRADTDDVVKLFLFVMPPDVDAAMDVGDDVRHRAQTVEGTVNVNIWNEPLTADTLNMASPACSLCVFCLPLLCGRSLIVYVPFVLCMSSRDPTLPGYFDVKAGTLNKLVERATMCFVRDQAARMACLLLLSVWTVS